jgi:acyl-CoA thioester hydrolase
MHENFTHKVKVYYEDTDVGGVVYYANFLKFMERSRTEMIYQQLNLNHNSLKNDFDCVFVVKSCNIKYLKPAKFEDELLITAKILKKSFVRVILLQEVKKKDEILVTAQIELAITDNNGKVKKLPENLYKKL